MNKESAFDILENITGGTDESTSYGEAVAFIRKLVEGQKPSTNSAMVPCPKWQQWHCDCPLFGDIRVRKQSCQLAQHQ